MPDPARAENSHVTFQRSFVGGVITQPNLNRKDTAKVASGVFDAKNGWFLPGGAFQSRAGSRFITTTKDQGEHVRIRRFFFNAEQAYALEVGEFYIRLYQLSAQAYANATIIEPDPFIIANQDIYPASSADDLIPLTGTLPSTPVSASEGFLNLALTEVAAGTTTRNIEAGPGPKVAVHAYTSLTGFPGAVIYWNNDVLTMRVKITNLTPSTGGSVLSAASLLPRLHRTTVGGVGQERISAGGLALGNPTSVTVPGGGAGVLTSIGVDLLAGGLGTYTFTWSGVGHWGNSGAAIASTDRITDELIFTFTTTGGGLTIMQYDYDSLNTSSAFPQAAPNQPGVPWDPDDQYVPGDVVFTGTGPLVYYYCVARHTGKNPDTVIYQNDFWYVLPFADSGNPILEIPTPYLAADVPDVVASMVQSGDTITITHRGYPPHELIRHFDPIYSFGRWTLLPIGFKPRTSAPTGLTITDPGDAGGDKTLRYKVTATDKETDSESAAGQYVTTFIGAVDADSAQSTVDDLAVNTLAHGLTTGAEIYISLVSTLDADRANENARIALEGTTWFVDVVDADNFTIRDTAGLITLPVISSIAEGYPQFTITWGLAYVELVSVHVPHGDGGWRIEFSWNEVPGAGHYTVYRTIVGEENWGFLSSTKELKYADEGDTETDGVKAIVDTDTVPPSYRSPFHGDAMWPRASAYHAQRQWFGGTADEPLRVWGSVTGDFRNFSTREISVASDSIDFVINSENSNEIQTMAALGVLLIFTSGAIWTLPGNVNGVISATEVPTLQTVSYEGASLVRPLIVGDSALFLQFPGSSVMRELRFNFQNGGPGGYDGRDLTLYAPELFKGYSFKSLARMSIPNSLAMAVRSDGAMLCLTYEQKQDIWGWSRMLTRPATDVIQDACTIPEDGADALYSIARRSVSSVDVWYVERMDQRRLGEAGQDPRLASFFVDSGLTFDGTNITAVTLELTGGTTWKAGETGLTLTASEALFPGDGSNIGNGYRIVGLQLLSEDGELLEQFDEVEVLVTADASTTVQTVTLLTDAPLSTRSTALASWVAMVDEISGLDHLEGEDVVVLADGHVFGPFTVTAGAIPAFSRPYGFIHAGLAIDVAFRTLSIDTGDNGQISAAYKTVKQAVLWLDDSYRPTLGQEGGEVFEIPVEHGDVEGTLINGPRAARIAARSDRDGSIVIRQSNPVPLCVTAVMLEYELGGI